MTPRTLRSVLPLVVIGLLILAPRKGSASFRGRRLDGVIQENRDASNDETYGSGGPADAGEWEAGNLSSDATLAVAASFQPRVTIVEGLRSRNGISSISNPGT
jgi:hypothetical protein